MPENAPSLLRLQRGVALAASLPAGSGSPADVSTTKLRRVLRLSIINDESVREQEDSYSQIFVESVSFHGGPYLVSPGMDEQAIFQLRSVLEAIFALDHGESLPAEYINEARIVALVLLKVSDHILRAAGLARGQFVPDPHSHEILVPNGDRLRQLAGASVISLDSFESLVPKESAEVLRRMTRGPGEISDLFLDEFSDPSLVLKPFLADQNEIVVLNPVDLASTLRHYLFAAAANHDCLSQLARRWRDALGIRVRRTLEKLKAVPCSEVQKLDLYDEYVYTFDGNKLAHVILVSDTLEDYDPANPWGTWRIPRLVNEVNKAISDFELDDAAEGVLHLVLFCAVRDAFLGLEGVDDARAAVLSLHPDDLDAIVELEDNPLGLWYFAKASTRLHNSTRVMSFSTLDEYANYRERYHSFYFSDSKLPAFINFAAGSAVDVRVEYQKTVDRHAVLASNRKKIVEVRRLHRSGVAPVYVTELGAAEIGLAYENSETIFWLIPEVPDHLVEQLFDISDKVVETLCHWCWQLDVSYPEFTRMVQPLKSVCIRLRLEASDAWFDLETLEDATHPPVMIEHAKFDTCIMTLSPSFARLVSMVDNRGDRILLEGIIRSILFVSNVDLSDQIVEEMIDRLAGNPAKRMLHGRRFRENVLAHPGRLPRVRYVQDALTAFILDDIGVWLREDKGLQTGPIEDERRSAVLNSVVGRGLALLAGMVAELSANGLLEFLISRDEALLYTVETETSTLPYRLAFFGADSVEVDYIRDRVQKANDAAVSSRFLIEYVAAQPPAGSRSINLERYDEMLAVAADIVTRGILSDAVNYGLSDARLSILPSGRLGISKEDSYYLSLGVFAKNRAARILNQANSIASAVSETRGSGVDRSQFAEEIEEASRAEFGFTYKQLGDVLGELVGLAAEQDVEPALMPEEGLIDSLVVRTGLDVELCRRVIDHLAIRPRQEFVGSLKADVYPWRYGRDMSYVRRPLIARPTGAGETEIVWGMRRCFSALGAWLDLFDSGRLKAKSAAMKKCIGVVRHKITEGFNDFVAARLSEVAGVSVHPRAKKFGRLRIEAGRGKDLGDVDVLVLDLANRSLIAVETKDFEVARTPAELSNEVDKLFEGEGSALVHHMQRVSWLKINMPHVLRHYGINSSANWTVEGVIVVSEPLVSSAMRSSSIPVLTLDEMIARLKRKTAKSRK